MTYETELLNKEFQLNIVIKIGAEYYSQYQVDSGLTIDADKLGTVMNVRLNPDTVDIRNVKTTLPSVSFSLLDKDAVISSQIMTNITNWMNETCIVYVGFITTAGFAFSEYKKLADTRIKSIRKVANQYAISAKDITTLVTAPSFQVASTLDGGISAVDTTLSLTDATDFPSSSTVGNNTVLLKINDEFLKWTGKSLNDLTGVTRADLSSTADAHSDDDEVFLVTENEKNPITCLLEILLSTDGSGTNHATYDVLEHGGLGIDAALVDVTEMESIRTVNFSTDVFRLWLYDVDDTLKYLEKELMSATNTRIVIKNSLISLSILDQVDFGASVPNLNEDDIVGNPTWKLDSNRVVNKIKVNWAWSEGLKKYTRVSESQNADSITDYGESKTLVLNFKGVQADLGGSAIASSRASRLLARLATPQASVQATAHFKESDHEVGDDVLVTHRYLPQQGASLGMSDQMEIMSRAIDFNTGLVRYKLEFTSYHGIRLGLIAPSPNISTIVSQSIITVPDGACYEVGYKVRLWDYTAQTYFADPINEIIAISGNQLTFGTAWATTLSTGYKIKFATYDDSSDLQRARYAYVGPNAGTFTIDGSKTYQITF